MIVVARMTETEAWMVVYCAGVRCLALHVANLKRSKDGDLHLACCSILFLFSIWDQPDLVATGWTCDMQRDKALQHGMGGRLDIVWPE